MSKKRYRIKAECPKCGCVNPDLELPDDWKDNYDPESGEVEVTCPTCGAKHSADAHNVKETEE